MGKSWDLHVIRVLETSLDENLRMISDSVVYLKAHGRRVIYDAEHFFDGYRSNPAYALRTLQAAYVAGADRVVLCDTNGGMLPYEIADIVAAVVRYTGIAPGIHAHNDTGTAVACTLAAVNAGADHIQGTVNGYGERCGNADMLTLIATLKLKMGIDCVTDTQLQDLTRVSLLVSELANMPPHRSQPYAGASAFTHKGLLHAAATVKLENAYEHTSPQKVGNTKRVVVSELSGRGNILYKVKELDLRTDFTPEQALELVGIVKAQESKGFQYEGAEASFELLVRRSMPGYRPPFTLVDFMSVVEKGRYGAGGGDLLSQTVVRIKIGDTVMHTAAEGNGPVNALDHAMRKALMASYPGLSAVRLVDYKVRIVDGMRATEAVTRVLIESTDGKSTWYTVGASANIIEASWMALADSMEYWLVRTGAEARPLSNPAAQASTPHHQIAASARGKRSSSE